MHQNLAVADAFRRESGQRPAWVCRAIVHGAARLTRQLPWRGKADAPPSHGAAVKAATNGTRHSVMFSHEPSYFVVSV